MAVTLQASSSVVQRSPSRRGCGAIPFAIRLSKALAVLVQVNPHSFLPLVYKLPVTRLAGRQMLRCITDRGAAFLVASSLHRVNRQYPYRDVTLCNKWAQPRQLDLHTQKYRVQTLPSDHVVLRSQMCWSQADCANARACAPACLVANKGTCLCPVTATYSWNAQTTTYRSAE